MTDKRLRPIKVVAVTQHDFFKPDPGGAPRKRFGEVDDVLRRTWKEKLTSVEEYFEPAFADHNIPAVAKVTLKPKAIAKSHRPKELFNENTCPIIGVRGFGELLVSVSRSGLSSLREKIELDSTKAGTASITTIQKIEPYTGQDALGSQEAGEATVEAAKRKKSLKVRLFQHHDPAENAQIVSSFERLCSQVGVTPDRADAYPSGMAVYRISGLAAGKVKDIAGFAGVQSLSAMPEYELVRASTTTLHAVEKDSFPSPQPAKDYPLVGIVDTGIATNDPVLGPWVQHRETFIADHEIDSKHGSFVAGLAVHGRLLNNDDRFPGNPVRLVDVVAIPNTGLISEDLLLQILRETLPKYPQVRYWNLSLNTSIPCSDHGFSDLAVALDELQDAHGVTFIVPVGNPSSADKWYRKWPPPNGWGDRDRICPPADSVRAVSVASIAHMDRPGWLVKRDEPSPFSRKGPGPVYLPKPELSHYGGNCNDKGHCTQTGVRSLDGLGYVAEDIGTSYAAPLITNILANVQSKIQGNPSRNLVRALTVHSAAMRSQSIDASTLQYSGFGIPKDIEEILSCSPSSITMIFEDKINHGVKLEKSQFPIPPCLRTADGRVHGGFLMTLVYEPPLDTSYGAEYCRSNVSVSLGTYDEKGHHKQVPEEPKYKNKKQYEADQIKNGFKWSPVKVYRRVIPRGIKGDDWRLEISLIHRSDFTPLKAQDFVLIVTMFDPTFVAPVYDQTVRLMEQIGWAVQDLRVEEQVRVVSR